MESQEYEYFFRQIEFYRDGRVFDSVVKTSDPDSFAQSGIESIAVKKASNYN